MILCHKCSGVLAGDKEETKDLIGCSCISSWIRGFEPVLNRQQAIEEQKRKAEYDLKFFTEQGRGPEFLATYQKRIERLSKL